jgi:HK97 family phage major capsid protein
MTVEELKKQLRSHPKSGNLMREMAVDSATIDKEKMYAEFSVSSETPVLRWFGYEILDHSTSSIRMGRLSDGAAHRDGHYGDQIGVIEKAWLDENERKLRVGVRFSQNTARAIEIFKDIADGIRRNVSIDYDIHEVRFEKEVDGVSYFRIVDWEPIHTCSTPDGADAGVGVGRSKENEAIVIPVEGDDVQGAIDKFNRENGSEIKLLFNKNNRGKSPMTDEEKRKAEEARVAAEAEARRSAAEKETHRIKGIRMMARDLQRNIPGVNLEDEAEKYVQQDKTEMDFYNFCREKMMDPEAVRSPEAHVDLSINDKKRYNLSRAILAASEGRIDSLGIEKEVSDEINKKLNRQASGKRLTVPTNLLPAKRAYQNVTTPAAGGNLVMETPTDRSFIEFLTNSLIATQAGVFFMSGMSGDVPFIRELDELGYYWTGESGHPTGSGITYSRVKATPKHLGAKTSLSRQMLLQQNMVSEAYVQRKLYGSIKKGIDRGLFYGSGTANQPLGVKNITGVHGTIGTGFTRDTAIDMKSAVRTDNAEIGGVNWLANPVTAGTLQKKAIVENYPSFLLNDDNVMIARKLLESNQIDEGDLFYGVWNTVILLEWGFIDISANPYGAGWDAGDIEVRALHAVDVFAEYPQALNVAEGVN